MKDYLFLGPTPGAEPASQLGSRYYDFTAANQLECRVYVNQLAKEYPDAVLLVKADSHEFGPYREACAVVYGTPEAGGFDSEDEWRRSVEAAYTCEIKANPRWTDESIAALRAGGYPESLLREIEEARREDANAEF